MLPWCEQMRTSENYTYTLHHYIITCLKVKCISQQFKMLMTVLLKIRYP